MFNLRRRCLILVAAIVVLAACATPASPAPTVIPTEPPTSTLVPPTVTSVSTHTPVPPTNTPLPTATPRPTNTLAPTATPLPTNRPKPTSTTKPAAPASTGGVSSKPSTLKRSIEQSFAAAQGMIGLFDQMLGGGGVELCAPLIEKYQSIHNAPTYDVSGQSQEAQQAYGGYRNGISILDTRADLILSCGQGGGSISELNLGLVRDTTGQAASAFATALDVIKLAPGISTLSPLQEAIVRAQRAIGGVGDVVNRMMMPTAPGQGARRIEADDPLCVEAMTSQNALPTFTMDPTGQPPSVQAAYQLYQEAINLYRVEVSDFPRACAAGEVVAGTVGFTGLYNSISRVLNKLTEAQNALK